MIIFSYKAFFLILSFIFNYEWSCFAVNRNDFKTCEQSSFCRRHRRLQPGISRYDVMIDTFKVSEVGIFVDVLNNENSVVFTLVLFPLEDSTFRIKFSEKNPLFPRFEEPYALLSDIKSARFEVLEKSAKGFKVKWGSGHLEVTSSPLKLDFYMDERLAISINAKGLLMFEHYRSKRREDDGSVDNGGGGNEEESELQAQAGLDDDIEAKVHSAVEEPEEEGMWEEDFKGHRDSKPRGPASLGVDISFLGSEHVYGIPEHADSFSLKSTGSGDPYRLYNLDVFEYELDNPMALYGSVPFMVSHSKEITVGLFWHNAAETWIDIKHLPEKDVISSFTGFFSGSSQEESPQVSTHWMSESGIMDIFLVLGPRPMDVFKQYAKLTGTTPLPPLFSLGYHQCRWNYKDMADVDEVHKHFDHFNLPMDVMWLDIEHTDNKKYFTWHPEKFSDPLEMTKNLTDKGRKLVVIVDPHIKKDSGYSFYQKNLDHDFYIKNKDGSLFEGWCWPGQSSYIDFTIEEARQFYADYYNLDKFKGSTLDTFIWNDMNEPSVFNGPEITLHKDALHSRSIEHRDMHNVNGMLFHSATYEGLLRRSGGRLRPFVLTRAHYAGTQRTSAVWTGDNKADWGHLRISVPMILSLSISGITHVGADVGGFFGNPSPDLLARWYQAAAFTTFFRAHAHIDTKRREPWLFGTPTLDLIREAIRDHYQLLPYIYTLFYENELNGAPPTRPLWAEFPSDENTFSLDSEYLLGSGLLVRPVVEEGASSASVYFPDGLWYDWKTGRSWLGPLFQTVYAPPNKIPVFVRGGTIIPLKKRPRRSSSLMRNDPITLLIALDTEGKAEGTLYFDDEHTMEYRKGHFLYLKLEFDGRVLTSKIIDPNGSYQTKVWLERVILYGVKNAPLSAKLIQGSSKVEKLETLYEVNEEEASSTLTIRKPGITFSSSSFQITLNYDK